MVVKTREIKEQREFTDEEKRWLQDDEDLYWYYGKKTFRNTHELSPVANDGVTPAKRGSVEWEAWWKEQKRRCIEGYEAGYIEETGGEMETGADQLMKMFYNPKLYNCREYENIYSQDYVRGSSDLKKVGYFVPCWKFHIVDEDGNSLRKESCEDLLRKRWTVEHDSEAYFKEMVNSPFSPEESFLIQGGNMFDLAKLNARLAEIKKSKKLSEIGEYGDLDRVDDDNWPLS